MSRFFTQEDVVRALRQRLIRSKKTQMEFAREMRVMPSFISDVLRGEKAPNPRICHALGFKKSPNVYVRI